MRRTRRWAASTRQGAAQRQHLEAAMTAFHQASTVSMLAMGIMTVIENLPYVTVTSGTSGAAVPG
jgi:Flp pilus assembly protein TadG